jgi:hypothetical protein
VFHILWLLLCPDSERPGPSVTKLWADWAQAGGGDSLQGPYGMGLDCLRILLTFNFLTFLSLVTGAQSLSPAFPEAVLLKDHTLLSLLLCHTRFLHSYARQCAMGSRSCLRPTLAKELLILRVLGFSEVRKTLAASMLGAFL